MSAKSFGELEQLATLFMGKMASSEKLFEVFMEIANGNNYGAKIARQLKKSKAIVSRQVRELVETRLVKAWGEGVKQTFNVDWEVFTYYWIYTFSPALALAGDIFELGKDILSKARIPEWMGRLYLSPMEWKALDQKRGQGKSPEDILMATLLPTIPDVAPLVEILVTAEPKTDASERQPRSARDFNDAFIMLSRSFAVGLPDLKSEFGIKLEEIRDHRTKEFITALYSNEVGLWLKINAFYDIYGANIVRNYVLDKLKLVKKQY